MVNEAGFVTLAAPGRKKKTPENATGEEDTVSESDRPTKIDPPEITQTTKNNAISETTHQECMSEAEEDYQPTPDAQQPPAPTSLRNCLWGRTRRR